MAKTIGTPKALEQYFPKGTPDFAFDAWASCLDWASRKSEIIERFLFDVKADLENKDNLSIQFIQWFNENIWGLEEL